MFPNPRLAVFWHHRDGSITQCRHGDDGEFEQALALCRAAQDAGLGKAYAAKQASIERMM